jgi:hypothetical protein
MSPLSVRAVRARTPWPGTDGVPEIAQKEIAPRQTVEYRCPRDHHFARIFAADIQVPVTWEYCPRCGATARLEGAPPAEDAPAPRLLPGKHKPQAEDTTPWGQLMKRRTRKDGEALLAEGRERKRQAGEAR